MLILQVSVIKFEVELCAADTYYHLGTQLEFHCRVFRLQNKVNTSTASLFFLPSCKLSYTSRLVFVSVTE